MRVTMDGGGCFPTGRHYPGIAHLIRIKVAGLVEEIPAERPLADIALVSIDTETTGRDPANDRIVEIACIVWEQGDVRERHSWLINPGMPIPEESRQVHGISDDDVKDQPTFASVCREVLEVLRGRVPVAYNAEFDRAFLTAELRRAGVEVEQLPPAARPGVEWVDPLVWARELQRDEKSRALSDVAARLGIEVGQAHRAADDAVTAIRVLAALAKDVRVPRSYGAFMQEQKRLFRLFEDERRLWRSSRV